MKGNQACSHFCGVYRRCSSEQGTVTGNRRKRKLLPDERTAMLVVSILRHVAKILARTEMVTNRSAFPLRQNLQVIRATSDSSEKGREVVPTIFLPLQAPAAPVALGKLRKPLSQGSSRQGLGTQTHTLADASQLLANFNKCLLILSLTRKIVFNRCVRKTFHT